MGIFKLSKMIPVGLGLLTFAGIVGSISGSLAWWAYSTRVSVSYQGTSVTTSEQLQVGLKLDTQFFDDAKVASLVALGLEEDESATIYELDGEGNPVIDPVSGEKIALYRYVFAKAGGGLPADTIKTYLEAEGVYSVNELAPITSRTYTTGGDFKLWESLVAGQQVNTETALKEKYTHLPFAFRILKLNAVSEDDKYTSGRDIYLSKIQALASSDNPDSKIGHALRIYIDGTNQFILNPNPELNVETGETVVCGALDLNPDHLYDTYFDGPNKDQEIIYGDYTVTGTTSTFVQDGEPTVLSNINGVDLPEDFDYTKLGENRTTFLAAHADGMTCYTNYSGITKGVAQYKTIKAIQPDATHAKLVGGESLCTTTDESGNFIANLDLTIWLEGWDHEVVDTAISHKFELNLQFQIDLVS